MIEIQLFKFDAKTDYLPYYKSYSINRENAETIDDILEKINAIETFGYLQNEAFFLKANNIFVSSDANLDALLANSNELILEPISAKRAVYDLVIDTKDYQVKLSHLDKYLSPEMKNRIITEKSYMLEYYASNTLHFHEDYIGEHVLQIASELVHANDSLQGELASLVNSENGISLRSSLKYRVLNSQEDASKAYESAQLNSPIVQNFENFNISLYCALNDSSFEEVILKSKARYVELQSKHFDIPDGAGSISLVMAGTVLLEAMDNNADFLIVNDIEELELFDEKQRQIEKVMGREIGLPVLTRDEFIKILEGEKDKKAIRIAFHKIKVPFLD